MTGPKNITQKVAKNVVICGSAALIGLSSFFLPHKLAAEPKYPLISLYEGQQASPNSYIASVNGKTATLYGIFKHEFFKKLEIDSLVYTVKFAKGQEQVQLFKDGITYSLEQMENGIRLLAMDKDALYQKIVLDSAGALFVTKGRDSTEYSNIVLSTPYYDSTLYEVNFSYPLTSDTLLLGPLNELKFFAQMDEPAIDISITFQTDLSFKVRDTDDKYPERDTTLYGPIAHVLVNKMEATSNLTARDYKYLGEVQTKEMFWELSTGSGWYASRYAGLPRWYRSFGTNAALNIEAPNGKLRIASFGFSREFSAAITKLLEQQKPDIPISSSPDKHIEYFFAYIPPILPAKYTHLQIPVEYTTVQSGTAPAPRVSDSLSSQFLSAIMEPTPHYELNGVAPNPLLDRDIYYAAASQDSIVIQLWRNDKNLPTAKFYSQTSAPLKDTNTYDLCPKITKFYPTPDTLMDINAELEVTFSQPMDKDKTAMKLMRGETQVPITISAKSDSTYAIKSVDSLKFDADYILFVHGTNLQGDSMDSTISFHTQPAPPETTSVEYPLQNGILKVYPNPTDGLLNLEISGSGQAEIKLFDAQGRIVGNLYNGPLGEETEHVRVDISALPAGVYYIYRNGSGIPIVVK